MLLLAQLQPTSQFRRRNPPPSAIPTNVQSSPSPKIRFDLRAKAVPITLFVNRKIDINYELVSDENRKLGTGSFKHEVDIERRVENIVAGRACKIIDAYRIERSEVNYQPTSGKASKNVTPGLFENCTVTYTFDGDKTWTKVLTSNGSTPHTSEQREALDSAVIPTQADVGNGEMRGIGDTWSLPNDVPFNSGLRTLGSGGVKIPQPVSYYLTGSAHSYTATLKDVGESNPLRPILVSVMGTFNLSGFFDNALDAKFKFNVVANTSTGSIYQLESGHQFRHTIKAEITGTFDGMFDGLNIKGKLLGNLRGEDSASPLTH